MDVVIIGGAFAGASTAILLKRQHPALRILIIERAEKFDRKVGEATTEISGRFLTKYLCLTRHLAHQHVAKQGLRLWFCSGTDDSLDDCGEMGAIYNTRLPAYQVDREVLDSHILEEAVALGVELWRPATVREINTGEGNNELSVVINGETRSVRAKWLVDASGRAAVLARKKGTFTPLTAHPTNAIWARFKGVKDWDSYEIHSKNPNYAFASHASRSAATNHLTGYGWWCWIIPLKGGDYSVGIVYDERIYQPPAGERLVDRLKAHLLQNPFGRELMADATHIEGDVKTYSKLAYYAKETAGPGWFIVGDAAGFMDALYSQGLDFCSWTASTAAAAISEGIAGRKIDYRKINTHFQQAYHGWFKGIYKDKYYYLGDADLMIPAFLMDLGLFFFGPVRDAVRFPEKGMTLLPFTETIGQLFAVGMGFYNRRLATIGQNRMRQGTYGCNNLNRRELISAFIPEWKVWGIVFRGARLWLWAEWKNFVDCLGEKRTRTAAPSAEPRLEQMT